MSDTKFIQLSAFDVNKTEAPVGFYAISKYDVHTPNVCNSCDAKKLCQENKDEWCLINRCMSWGRNDGQTVVFKKTTQ